jgi:hypothetical protein
MSVLEVRYVVDTMVRREASLQVLPFPTPSISYYSNTESYMLTFFKEKTNKFTSIIYFFYLFVPTCFGRFTRPLSGCSTLNSTVGYNILHPCKMQYIITYCIPNVEHDDDGRVKRQKYVGANKEEKDTLLVHLFV